jgi:DNA-binding MarR family transcriptional regulator
MALLDGRALPASVLATEAGVSASTMSEHLARLLDGRLVTVERQGRARYYRLAGASVAEALEALARISPPQPVRSLRQGNHAAALRAARTCYSHLAGRLGVALMAGLLENGLLEGRPEHPGPPRDPVNGPGRDASYRLTGAGKRALAGLGVDLLRVERSRPEARYCVDWSEQRPHLAGPLGAALTSRLLQLDWIRRGSRRRTVTLTEAGRVGLHASLGLPEDWDRPA